MKKHCTRIASLALVLALLISTMVPAFAAGAPVMRDNLPESSEAAEDPVVLPDGDEEEPVEEQEAEPANEEAPAEPVPEVGEAAAEVPAMEESGIALLAETEAGNDGFTKGTEEGSNYWWKLDADGTLTIKGTRMADWDVYNNRYRPWYTNRESIRKVVIQEGITNIGGNAFAFCRNLTGALIIPDSVTSIGNRAFLGCSSLTGTLTIPAGVTSIGESAFCYCSSLTGTLTIPAGVTSIGESAFCDCSGLTGSLTIPSSVTSIGHRAFMGCSGLTGSIMIPLSVTDIGDAPFASCEGVTEILVDMENANYCSEDGILYNKDKTSLICVLAGKTGTVNIPLSVTRIGESAFRNCSGLTGITIPSSVTSIGAYAFSSCSGLTSVMVPEGVTWIDGATFAGCSGLTSFTIPSSVTSIGGDAFSGCSSLTSITIPAGVTYIGANAFSESRLLNKILFKGDAPEFYNFNNFFDVTATVYYPQNNATWTEEVRQQYCGTLTWVPYDPENPPSMEPEDSEAPEEPAGSENPTNPEKPENPENPTDPEKPEDPAEPGTPNTWQNTPDGAQYLGADGMPLTGSNWIEALGHRYVFDDNGILQTGNADGDLLWKGNQYYLNPDRDPNDPTTCYCVINYTRRREAGVTYYNQDGITYRGWVDGGNGKLLYQTVLRGTDGKELKDEAGFSTYIYVWSGQQIPEGRDPLDEKKTIAAGNYLFGEDGVLVTGRTGWYTIPGSSAIAGEYYLTGTDGQCALNTTIWDDAKGHRYLFGADGRKVSAGKDGLDVALTINGQYQTVYLAPDTDYVACNYYRPRQDSKGGDLGLTYYNPDGITYRGWVDGGNGKRLYQTVMKIEGKDLYFIVWRAQYLPAGKDPVTKDPIPAGWYLFDDNGVLITKDGVYTYPDTKGVDHQYQVKGGKIVAIDGKAPGVPGDA